MFGYALHEMDTAQQETRIKNCRQGYDVAIDKK